MDDAEVEGTGSLGVVMAALLLLLAAGTEGVALPVLGADAVSVLLFPPSLSLSLKPAG
jgi:hypothetical protein